MELPRRQGTEEGPHGFRAFRERSMITTRILLHAYYERLYEIMAARREELFHRVDILLAAEIKRREFGPMGSERMEAYRQACRAFIDERFELYNPIGIQYTFDSAKSSLTAELEFQLDWYDSRAEFAALVAATKTLVRDGVSDDRIDETVNQLIRQAGAFPDRSIIAGYTAKPTGQKLPDYIVASAIEQVVCPPEI